MKLFRCSLVVALAAALPAQISLPSVIDDTTFGPLLAGREYVASQRVTVPQGKTQTIQPGAIVKFARNGFLLLQGRLRAVGTQSSRIVFTSIHDRSVGSATGSGTPKPGDWKGIDVLATVPATAIEFADVRFAGLNRSGSVQVFQSSPTLRNVTIRDGASTALRAVTVNTTFQPIVASCAFRDCGGVAVSGMTVGVLGGFTNNTASGNAGGDYFDVNPSFGLRRTLTLGPGNQLGGVLGVFRNLTIVSGASLTLEAGTVLKFLRSGGIRAIGPLVLDGTAARPVVLTSAADDSIAGDTLKDGPTTGKPGDWSRVSLENSSSRFRSALLRFGGGFGNGMVLVVGARTPTIEDSTFEFSKTSGIDLNGSRTLPFVRRCTFRDNEVRAYGGVVGFDFLARTLDNVAMRNKGGDHIAISTFASIVGKVAIRRQNTLNANGVIVSPAGLTVFRSSHEVLLGPGIILKLTNDIRISGGGTLVFDGRGDDPIYVTSEKDDRIGGDTNLDGNATRPGPGDWGAIRYLPGAKGSMAHVHTRFGGGRSNAGMIECSVPDVRITSVRADRSATDGIRLANVQGVAANLVAWENRGDGIELLGAAFDAQHITSTRNTGAGVRIASAYTGTVFNSISWKNGTRDEDNYIGFGGGKVQSSNGLRVRGNIFDDPKFVDPVAGDLRISPFVLSVGRADLVRALRWGVDFDGNSRVLDHALNGLALPDMGAYEVFQYRMAVDGLPRPGATLKLTVGGPGPKRGFQVLFVGPAVGGEFTPPFGVLITGTLASSVIMSSQPTATPFSLAIPDRPDLVGQRFGLQYVVISDLARPAGNLCNAFLATIAP